MAFFTSSLKYTVCSFPPFLVMRTPFFFQLKSFKLIPTSSDTRIPVPSKRVTMARSLYFVFSHRFACLLLEWPVWFLIEERMSLDSSTSRTTGSLS